MSDLSVEDVSELLGVLEEAGIEVTVDGGWAVDALLGSQTRTHEDLDIAMPEAQVARLRQVLAERGFAEIERDDSSPCAFVLRDGRGRTLDVHAYTLDERGGNASGVAYEAAHLTGSGVIGGRSVRCIEPATLVRFHTGYPLDAEDVHDVRLLCKRFSIPVPDEYATVVDAEGTGTAEGLVPADRAAVSSVTIRSAESTDASIVADVYLRSRATHVRCAPVAHPPAEVQRWVREVLLVGSDVRVATIEGGVVGMIATSRDGDVDWIDQLYVAPERVGHGIGAALLRHALERLGRPVRLWTFQPNEGARQFYARHGFREIELTDGRDNEERCPDVLCERR